MARIARYLHELVLLQVAHRGPDDCWPHGFGHLLKAGWQPNVDITVVVAGRGGDPKREARVGSPCRWTPSIATDRTSSQGPAGHAACWQGYVGQPWGLETGDWRLTRRPQVCLLHTYLAVSWCSALCIAARESSR